MVADPFLREVSLTRRLAHSLQLFFLCQRLGLAATAGMISEQRMVLNLLLSSKEAAGRGRLDPWVGATFPDMMKLPTLPGFVFSFVFKRHFRVAGIFPGAFKKDFGL